MVGKSCSGLILSFLLLIALFFASSNFKPTTTRHHIRLNGGARSNPSQIARRFSKNAL